VSPEVVVEASPRAPLTVEGADPTAAEQHAASASHSTFRPSRYTWRRGFSATRKETVMGLMQNIRKQIGFAFLAVAMLLALLAQD
jgi:hypothetical protein